MHWGYWVPLGILLLAALYVSADVDSSRAENSPTRRLRVMFSLWGLVFIYFGILGLLFDIGRFRVFEEGNKLGPIFIIIMGVAWIIAGLVRSRANLVRDSDYVTEHPADIELFAGEDIDPADRYKKQEDKQ